VFIFDDLHWVDPASRQFIENLCQSLENVSIMLVLIAREFEQLESPRLISIAAGKHTRTPLQINLVPLSAIDSRLLIDQLVKETTVKANVVKTSIADRASGNPYYVEELVRISWIGGFAGRWELASNKPSRHPDPGSSWHFTRPDPGTFRSAARPLAPNITKSLHPRTIIRNQPVTNFMSGKF
jgi:hypothetical protein